MKEQTTIRLGMVGLGRMGANMVRRLMRGGHRCVVFDLFPKAVEGLAKEGAMGAASGVGMIVAGISSDRRQERFLHAASGALLTGIGFFGAALLPAPRETVGSNLVGGGQFGTQAELKSESAKRRVDRTDWQKETFSWSKSFPAK